jgi:8-oxo-dGTP pyrophosphatase MutT (NUDIX family)
LKSTALKSSLQKLQSPLLNYQVFLSPPSDFKPTMQAAGCYCCCDDHLLLVKRQSFKSQGDKWGVPAGKLEKDENPADTVIRELKEEVGLPLSLENLQHIGTLFIRLPPIDYIYYMFFTHYPSFPQVIVDLSENQEARWSTLEDALKLPLMAAGAEALLHYRQFLVSYKQKRSIAKKNEIN